MGVKYLLDTNIISNPAKRNPDSMLMSNLAKHQGEWAICSIVWRELHYRWQKMTPSVKKEQIGSYIRRLAESDLVILSFDKKAAQWLGCEQAKLEKEGKTAPYVDGEIASIAATQQLVLVTRNTKDFAGFDNLHIENWFAKEH